MLAISWWNFKCRFLGPSGTDSNCHGDICPCNICPGDICPYQEYLSCYWPDSDETFNVGSWQHLEQILNPILSLNITPNIEHNIEHNIECNIQPNIQPNNEHNIESNIEPNIAKLNSNFNFNFNWVKFSINFVFFSPTARLPRQVVELLLILKFKLSTTT